MSTIRFPHPLSLLVGCILLAAALSYMLPAGQFERRDDPITGRRVVVAGTYHVVPPRHVNIFQALVAVPRGMADAASVIFLVFLVGGSFAVVDQTGVLNRGVAWFSSRLSHRGFVIPIVCVLFAAAGALENMQEEIIALVPALMLLTGRLGFDAVTAVAMSLGAAAVGAAFSPINPFQAGIAQKLAGLPLFSGSLFRLAFMAPALGIWIWGTARYAARTSVAAQASPPEQQEAFSPRSVLVLTLVLAAFGAMVAGVLRFGWDFDQMSALFFAMGILAGLVGGLGVEGTALAFVEGFKSMAFAGVLIGFARAVYLVLDQGQIIDTIVHALLAPIANLPPALAALGMMAVQTLIHVPVPSVSGQAVLTMPLLVPLSDLLRLQRQVTVLAYQYGAGLCELITPTNGALMAMLAAAGVGYGRWLKFAAPLYLILVVWSFIAIVVGVAIGLQ